MNRCIVAPIRSGQRALMAWFRRHLAFCSLINQIRPRAGGTGVRGLTTGLATFPQGALVKHGDGRPQENPWWCTASVCV